VVGSDAAVRSADEQITQIKQKGQEVLQGQLSLMLLTKRLASLSGKGAARIHGKRRAN
jgi:hypothetical protein